MSGLEATRFFVETRNNLATNERLRILQKRQMASDQRNRRTSGLSKSAKTALDQMAAKQDAKELKAIKKRVLIKPRNYNNGHLAKDGTIYDVAGSIIGKVDKATGQIKLANGASFGRYNSKSYMTSVAIQNAINQYSPYFINQRKMAMQQQGMGVWGSNDASAADMQQTAMLGGGASGGMASAEFLSNHFGGAEVSAPPQASVRGGVNETIWGSRGDNVWGTTGNTVWGTTSEHIWEGGSDSFWGYDKTARQISKMASYVAAFFGLKSRK